MEGGREERKGMERGKRDHRARTESVKGGKREELERGILGYQKRYIIERDWGPERGMGDRASSRDRRDKQTNFKF